MRQTPCPELSAKMRSAPSPVTHDRVSPSRRPAATTGSFKKQAAQTDERIPMTSWVEQKARHEAGLSRNALFTRRDVSRFLLGTGRRRRRRRDLLVVGRSALRAAPEEASRLPASWQAGQDSVQSSEPDTDPCSALSTTASPTGSSNNVTPNVLLTTAQCAPGPSSAADAPSAPFPCQTPAKSHGEGQSTWCRWARSRFRRAFAWTSGSFSGIAIVDIASAWIS